MRIREIIEEQGLTTKVVADKLEISLSALNQSISGNPSLKSLQKIADVLNVPVWELLVSPDELHKTEQDLCGHIEYKGVVYTIKSRSDLEKLLKMME